MGILCSSEDCALMYIHALCNQNFSDTERMQWLLLF